MRYIKKSTKFQPHENGALTASNRPSVSAPHSDWPVAIFRLLALLRSPPCAGFFVAVFYAVNLRALT